MATEEVTAKKVILKNEQGEYLIPFTDTDGNSRNIGETVFSLLPLTDSGLHLVDGSLIPGDGIYAGFVAHIAKLYGDGAEHPAYFVTEEQWQTSVSTYGVCGKFVYDESANTVRLPKVTGIVEGTIDVNALGALTEAGLPAMGLNGLHAHNRGSMDISGTFNVRGDEGALPASDSIGAGAFYAHPYTVTGVKLFENSGGGNPNGIEFYSFQASRNWTGVTSTEGNHTHTMGALLGKSKTVQPQTIKGFLYIIIASAAKTEIEVDIDKIATDLNGKANVDLSNLNETGEAKFSAKLNTDLSNLPAASKQLITGWGHPSLIKGIDMVLGATGATYTAPADGYIWLMGSVVSAGIGFNSIRQATFISQVVYDQQVQNVSHFAPVSKGTYYVDHANMSFTNFRFVYAKGDE